MPNDFRSNPEYQRYKKQLQEAHAGLCRVRWTDEGYRQAMRRKNSERALRLWSTPEYVEKQKRQREARKKVFHVNDTLKGLEK